MQTDQSEQNKRQNYQQKLKLIDQHAIRTTKVDSNNPDFDFILRLIALKLFSEPPVEMFPDITKNIIFSKLQPKRLYINQQRAQKDKKFILHVTTHVPAKINISFEQQKGKLYYLNKSKAIELNHTSWNKLDIVVQIERISMISEVRLLLNQIKANRDTPKKIGVNLRPKIDNQLEDYLKEARGKTADIIRQRSLNRIKQCLARRSSKSLRESKKSTQLIRTKSQLLKFQKQKSLYLKHVSKMSPQRLIKLNNEKLSYQEMKRQQIINFTKMIFTIKMALYIKQQTIRIHNQRFKNIKNQLLCIQFIKLLKNKLRVKITQKARLRMNVLHNLKMMPHIIKPAAIKKAKIVLMQALIPYMEFRGLQEIAENSQQYMLGLKKVQTFLRKKRNNFRQRIKLILQNYCQKLKISLSQKSKEEVIKKYLKTCLDKKTTRFFLNKSVLLEFLNEKAQ